MATLRDSGEQIRDLTTDELGIVSGAAVLEFSLGRFTFQWNLDCGCWAVWNGKELALKGGC
jgi:hypothetical protein